MARAWQDPGRDDRVHGAGHLAGYPGAPAYPVEDLRRDHRDHRYQEPGGAPAEVHAGMGAVDHSRSGRPDPRHVRVGRRAAGHLRGAEAARSAAVPHHAVRRVDRAQPYLRRHRVSAGALHGRRRPDHRVLRAVGRAGHVSGQQAAEEDQPGKVPQTHVRAVVVRRRHLAGYVVAFGGARRCCLGYNDPRCNRGKGTTMAQEYARIFAALDGASTQEAVAQRAVTLAADNHAKLMFGHVIDSVPYEASGVDFEALCAEGKKRIDQGVRDAYKNSIENKFKELYHDDINSYHSRKLNS